MYPSSAGTPLLGLAAALLLMTLLRPPPVAGRRQPQRRPVVRTADYLPRRPWRHVPASPGTFHGGFQQFLANRQQRHLAGPVNHATGHWRALHDKLDTQSTWPGTARYADEASLPATTVRPPVVPGSKRLPPKRRLVRTS